MKKGYLVALSIALALSACGKKKKDTPATPADPTTTTTETPATTTTPTLLSNVSPAAMAAASKAYVHAAIPSLAGSASFDLAATGAESIWSTADCVHYNGEGSGLVSLATFLKEQTDDTLKGSAFGDFTLDMDHFCMFIYFVPTKDSLGVPVNGTYSNVAITNTATMRTACNLSAVTVADLGSNGAAIDTVTITVSTPTDTTYYDKKIVVVSGDGDNTVYYRYDRSGNINLAAFETNDTASDHLDMANRTLMSYNATTQVTRFERSSHNFFADSPWKYDVRIFHTETTKRTDIFLANTINASELNMSIAGTDTQYAVSLATTTADADTSVDATCKNLDKYNACVSATTVVAGSGNTGATITCNKVSPTVMTNSPTFAWTTHATSASYLPTQATALSFTTAAEMYTKVTP